MQGAGAVLPFYQRPAAYNFGDRNVATMRQEPDLNVDATRTTSEDIADADLVRSMQNGDQGAIATLYDRYSGVAYGLAVRITGDRTLAEDVVQEAFVSVWKQCGRFNPARGQVKSWLLTIVHHRAIDAVRRRTNRAERALPEGPDEFIAQHGRPDELADATLDAVALRDAVNAVPEDQRRTIEMAYFEGLTHVEIAQRMGVPLGTVKSRLRIGLEKMRESLKSKVLE
jgi:RNA polymerase sigma-70 factor (ECF subfamily)